MNSKKRLILLGYAVGVICLLTAWIIRDNAFDLAKPSNGTIYMDEVLRATSAWIDEALLMGGFGFVLILLTFHHHLQNPTILDRPLVVQSMAESDATIASK